MPKHVLRDYSDRIELVAGDHELCEGVYLVPHKTAGLDKIGKREMMFVRTDSGFKPDDFSHEQSLVLETDRGLKKELGDKLEQFKVGLVKEF